MLLGFTLIYGFRIKIFLPFLGGKLFFFILQTFSDKIICCWEKQVIDENFKKIPVPFAMSHNPRRHVQLVVHKNNKQNSLSEVFLLSVSLK